MGLGCLRSIFSAIILLIWDFSELCFLASHRSVLGEAYELGYLVRFSVVGNF